MRAEEKGTTKERVEAMQKKFDVSYSCTKWIFSLVDMTQSKIESTSY